MNGNDPGCPEKALVSYPVIVAATKGDPDAMKNPLFRSAADTGSTAILKLEKESGAGNGLFNIKGHPT